MNEIILEDLSTILDKNQLVCIVVYSKECCTAENINKALRNIRRAASEAQYQSYKIYKTEPVQERFGLIDSKHPRLLLFNKGRLLNATLYGNAEQMKRYFAAVKLNSAYKDPTDVITFTQKLNEYVDSLDKDWNNFDFDNEEDKKWLLGLRKSFSQRYYRQNDQPEESTSVRINIS